MKVISRIILAIVLFVWVLLIAYPYIDLLFMWNDLTVAYVLGAVAISTIALVSFLYVVNKTNWISRFN